MRPVLKPALRRLWRDSTTVQLGIDPQHAVVLDELSAPLIQTLDLLDGTRDREQVLLESARFGASPLSSGALLETLARTGALDDAAHPLAELGLLPPAERDRLGPELAGLSLRRRQPGEAVDVLARRRRARVAVVGSGRVGAAVAAQLAASGVGALSLLDPGATRPGDTMPGGLPLTAIGRPRAAAAADLVHDAAPATHVEEVTTPPSTCDLVVVTAVDSGDPELLHALVRSGADHLLANVRETRAVVGPYVQPGRTSCSRCHDLCRAERDPAWPRLAAQLSSRPRGLTEACETTLAAVAAATAALHTLAILDGEESTLTDATLELAPPDWRLRRRSWPAHPACGCQLVAAQSG